MLSQAEKAYCRALLALKQKEYAEAVGHFDAAAGEFQANKEFNLLWETTKLLVAVKDELAAGKDGDKLEIEEVFSNG